MCIPFIFYKRFSIFHIDTHTFSTLFIYLYRMHVILKILYLSLYRHNIIIIIYKYNIAKEMRKWRKYVFWWEWAKILKICLCKTNLILPTTKHIKEQHHNQILYKKDTVVGHLIYNLMMNIIHIIIIFNIKAFNVFML